MATVVMTVMAMMVVMVVVTVMVIVVVIVILMIIMAPTLTLTVMKRIIIKMVKIVDMKI